MEGRVIMTGRTYLRGALEHIINMALFTSHIGVSASQLEGREIVVKGGRLPARNGMADAAILTKFSAMRIILLMT